MNAFQSRTHVIFVKVACGPNIRHPIAKKVKAAVVQLLLPCRTEAFTITDLSLDCVFLQSYAGNGQVLMLQIDAPVNYRYSDDQ